MLPPLDATALRRIEQRLKRRDVAAFVMEPISINLGVLIPEKDAIRRLRDLCRRYGTLFIADEVACGFGRTGRLFACEHFDLDPDMLCVAKAMSGGLAPVPPQRAARVDRRIDGAVAAVAGNRQADGRERAGYSGALDLTRRDGVAPKPRIQPAVRAFSGTCPRTSQLRGNRESSTVNQGIAANH